MWKLWNKSFIPKNCHHLRSVYYILSWLYFFNFLISFWRCMHYLFGVAMNILQKSYTLSKISMKHQWLYSYSHFQSPHLMYFKQQTLTLKKPTDSQALVFIFEKQQEKVEMLKKWNLKNSTIHGCKFKQSITYLINNINCIRSLPNATVQWWQRILSKILLSCTSISLMIS